MYSLGNEPTFVRWKSEPMRRDAMVGLSMTELKRRRWA